MRIAYINSYIGSTFLQKYLKGKSYTVSGNLKSQGIARALLAGGHEVTIFSSAITTCNRKISAFSENEIFPEGTLRTVYPTLFSYPKMSPINDIMLGKEIKRLQKKEKFDLVIFYNISFSAIVNYRYFRKAIKVLDYEDNVFNQALAGDKLSNARMKKIMYNFMMKRIDGLMAVCMGMYNNIKVKHKVLTPGIIGDDVLQHIDNREKQLTPSKPVKIFLIGGVHYSKGADLLINALQFVEKPCEVHFFSSTAFYPAALEAIEKVPVQHQVILNGYMEHEQLMRHLTETADMLINTTRSMGVGERNAGFPFKMLEYAAIGRPIVSSSIGKLDDEFNKHVSYYDEDKPEAIAEVVNEVIANYDEKAAKALLLQKEVIEKYSIKGISNELESFIIKLSSNEF